MNADIVTNLKLFAPELVLIAGLVVLFIVDAVSEKARSSYLSLYLVVATCLAGIFATCSASHLPTGKFFSGMVSNDPFSAFFRYLFFGATAVSAYVAFGSKEVEAKSRSEFSLLLICVTFGLSLMALSANFLSLYIGIETVSIVSFVLAGFKRESIRSNEASFKYLVFGALGSGIMIYGISLVYGFTGSLQYADVAKYLTAHFQEAPFVNLLALLMIYAGLAYKISSFPMHYWTPDVYEGSPTPVATFFSVGPKAAGFAALLRVVLEVTATHNGDGTWKVLEGSSIVSGLAIIATLTMFVGNLSALGQRNVKRMLAYSSIAHVGYMLMGLVTLTAAGMSAILFYLLVYAIMNIGAFWIVGIVSDRTGSEDLTAFKGLGWSSPTIGICMAIFLFSLTGIPMFSGFIGKFLLFGALVKTPGFLWLAVIGVLNSVVSFYYYAQILKAVWLERPASSEAVPVSLYHTVALVGLAIPTIVLGLYFTPVIRLAEKSLSAFQ